MIVDSSSTGVLPRGIDVGNPQAQVRTTPFRNPRIGRSRRAAILIRLAVYEKWYSFSVVDGSKSAGIPD